MQKGVYFILRIAIAMSMFGHGLVRLPKLQAFAEGMVTQFEASLIPTKLILPFAYLLAITEMVVGILLILGLFTRVAAWIGAATMFTLLFGSCMIESFGALPSQLIHTLFFAALLQFEQANAWSLDQICKKEKRA